MKNLSIALNVVLLIAVAVLYYLQFSGKSGADQSNQKAPASTLSGPLKIAYINSDSLLKNYDFYKEKSEELNTERDRLKAQYESRAKGLETEIANFQRTVANLTIGQARAIEEDLGKKQQNLLQYQESLSQQLLKKEADINNELYDSVSSFLKEFGKENNLEIVLTYTRGSGVWYANDSLNITQVIVDGLNDRYRNQSTTQADSTATN
ncbi:OmpH family outer membrane protein [Fulvivirgaceae bacterium BMA10]|uniref:OmpH family outer membrane protein n=1 Tax=Splendidivirga corallicola TaxID=3051826 RepID=A0ABT8KX28_9BACT|nr:OmpH family outer membrane protein [Fulvivirgaceae bacterium BMA10]